MNKTSIGLCPFSRGDDKQLMDTAKKVAYFNKTISKNLLKIDFLDELNDVIKTLKRRQENYFHLIEVFRKKKDMNLEYSQSISTEQLQVIYQSIKQQEVERVKEESSILTKFQGAKIIDQRQKMFVSRFCMRVCEIHEQGIKKLKTLALFGTEIEKQNNDFMQKLQKQLQLEELQLESILNILINHFARVIDEELLKIKREFRSIFFMPLEDKQNEKIQQSIVIDIPFTIDPLNQLETVLNQNHQSEKLNHHQNQKENVNFINKKAGSESLGDIMKQQQKLFNFYSKKFFILYDVLSLDKSFIKNQVSQLRLGNIDKHLFELIAKNQAISDSLKSYILIASSAKIRTTNSSPSLSPKRAQKNRQSYISRLLTINFFGSEVNSLLSKKGDSVQTSSSLIQQNSSFYQYSPEKEQNKSSPQKNINSQMATYISKLNSQYSKFPISQIQYFPIRLYSVGCQQSDLDQLQDSPLKQNNENQCDGGNAKIQIIQNAHCQGLKGSFHQEQLQNLEQNQNISKSNFRQNPFLKTKKVIVQESNINNSGRSFLLNNSNNDIFLSTMKETAINDRPKGTVRFIKKQGISNPVSAIKQNQQGKEEIVNQASFNTTSNQLQLNEINKSIKLLPEIVDPFCRRQNNLSLPSSPSKKIKIAKIKKNEMKNQNNLTFGTPLLKIQECKSVISQKQIQEEEDECLSQNSDFLLKQNIIENDQKENDRQQREQLNNNNNDPHTIKVSHEERFSIDQNSIYKIDQKQSSFISNQHSLSFIQNHETDQNQFPNLSEARKYKIKHPWNDMFSDNCISENHHQQNKTFYLAQTSQFQYKADCKKHQPSNSLDIKHILKNQNHFDAKTLQNQQTNPKSQLFGNDDQNHLNNSFTGDCKTSNRLDVANTFSTFNIQNCKPAINISLNANNNTQYQFPKNQNNANNSDNNLLSQSFDNNLKSDNDNIMINSFNTSYVNHLNKLRASKSTYEEEIDQQKRVKQLLKNCIFANEKKQNINQINSINNQTKKQQALIFQSKYHDSKVSGVNPLLPTSVNIKNNIQKNNSLQRKQKILIVKNDFSNQAYKESNESYLENKQLANKDTCQSPIRRNNFLLSTNERKNEINFPKITKEYNQPISQSSSGSTPITNQTYSKS